MGVIVWSPLAGGWLSGKYRKGKPVEAGGRAARIPERLDPAKPENQAKFEVVEALIPLAEKEGVPLAVLAVAWTLVHPSVTSAIVGPRTMEQFEALLPAADLDLSDAILDAIDEIVPPGETVNNADLGFENIWLRPERRRRSFTRT